MAVEIPFRRDFDAAYGALVTISPTVRRMTARNPGPFTFKGTNTYVIGHGEVAILDPGPLLDEHIDALLDALKGETLTHILISHTHLDHTAAVPTVKEGTGAPTYGFGPHQSREGMGGDLDFTPDVVIRDGDTIEGKGWALTALHTPGHAGNHLCFALPQENALFSADHVMGWSTSVVSPPDGDMADYFRSLEKLRGRTEQVYWPGHGPEIPDPAPFIEAFIAHRRERETAILDRIAAGDETIEAMLTPIYGELDPKLRPAAARSVLAHLVKLVAEGRVESDGPPTLEARYRRRHL